MNGDQSGEFTCQYWGLEHKADTFSVAKDVHVSKVRLQQGRKKLCPIPTLPKYTLPHPVKPSGLVLSQ